MKRQNLPLYAIGMVLIAGLAFVGVPWQWMLIGLLVLACPAMHVFMHGGHGGHGGHAGSDQHAERPDDHQHGPTAGRR